MTGYTTKNGFFIVPFGRNVLEFLENNEISVIWNEESLSSRISQTSFFCDENTPPQIIPITINIPFEINQEVVAPPRNNDRGAQRIRGINDAVARVWAAPLRGNNPNLNEAVIAPVGAPLEPIEDNEDEDVEPVNNF